MKDQVESLVYLHLLLSSCTGTTLAVRFSGRRLHGKQPKLDDESDELFLSHVRWFKLLPLQFTAVLPGLDIHLTGTVCFNS